MVQTESGAYEKIQPPSANPNPDPNAECKENIGMLSDARVWDRNTHHWIKYDDRYAGILKNLSPNTDYVVRLIQTTNHFGVSL